MTARAQTGFIVVGELRIERSHPLLRCVVGNEHDVVLAPRRENDEIRAEARRFGFERHDRSALTSAPSGDQICACGFQARVIFSPSANRISHSIAAAQ
jgi:hypothetical protein